MSDLVGNPEDRFSRVEAHIRCFTVREEKKKMTVKYGNRINPSPNSQAARLQNIYCSAETRIYPAHKY